jgi:hypothetical protein
MRHGWILGLAAVAAVAGCRSVERRDVLNPRPDPVYSVGANAPWLTPLPTPADRAGERAYGFNPFPTKPKKRRPILSPFPVKDPFAAGDAAPAAAAPVMPAPAPAPKAPK